MINDNRVAATDDEMVDWAREILNGKTEEIRNVTEGPAAADTPVDDSDQTAALPAYNAPTADDLRFNRVD